MNERPRRFPRVLLPIVAGALVVVLGVSVAAVVTATRESTLRNFTSAYGPAARQLEAAADLYRSYTSSYDPKAEYAPDRSSALWTGLLVSKAVGSADDLLPAEVGGQCSDPTGAQAFLFDTRTGTLVSPTLLRPADSGTARINVSESGAVKSAEGLWLQLVHPEGSTMATFFATSCSGGSEGLPVHAVRYSRSFPIAPDDPVLDSAATTQRDKLVMTTEDALLDVGFDRVKPGEVYDRAAAESEWDNGNGSLQAFTVYPKSSLAESADGAASFLTKDFAAGSYNNGPDEDNNKLNVVWRLDSKRTEAYFAYRMRTNDEFDPALGGKLPGLCGGACPVGGAPVVADAASGSGAPRAVGWSARNMWRANGYLVQYTYLPGKNGTWGTDQRYSDAGRLVYVNDGLWHTIEHRVVMNTPGKSDGILQAWVDGVQVLNMTGVRYRDDYSYGIDSVKFSSYFGGHSAEWAPTADSQIDFDDVVLSPVPISHDE